MPSDLILPSNVKLAKASPGNRKKPLIPPNGMGFFFSWAFPKVPQTQRVAGPHSLAKPADRPVPLSRFLDRGSVLALAAGPAGGIHFSGLLGRDPICLVERLAAVPVQPG